MTTETPSVGPLIAKLAEIMADTIRMPKGERNPQGWSYTSVMDMLDEIRPAMAQRGIVMVPDVETCEWTEGQSARGTATTTCHMTVRWTLYGSDGASISFRTVGEALDTSDKATNKAMTAAQKLCRPMAKYKNIIWIRTGIFRKTSTYKPPNCLSRSF